MKTISVVGVGSENDGVGSIVDSIVEQSEATAVALYNGGPYRSSFVRRGGITHQFSQFGSGMLIPEVKTYLMSQFTINPAAMMAEAESLTRKNINGFSRTFISGDCAICTPYHTAFSRLGKSLGWFASDWTGAKAAGNYNERLTAKDILYGGKWLREKLTSVHSELIEKFSEYSAGHDELIDPVHFDLLTSEEEPLIKCYEKFASMAKILHGDYMQDLLSMERFVINEGNSEYSSRRTVGVVKTFSSFRGIGDETLHELIEDDDNLKSETEVKWLGSPTAGVLNLDSVKQKCMDNRVTDLAVTHCDKLKKYSDWKLVKDKIMTTVPSQTVINEIQSAAGPVWIESHGKLSSNKQYKN